MPALAADQETRGPGARPRRTAWILGAILVSGLALRFATLAEQSLWFDEGLTRNLVVAPFGRMVSGLVDTETNPPLYYVLTYLSVHVVGAHEVGLRLVSALAGTATIPVAFMAGREVASGRAGLWAAGLVAVNPMLVWFSQEARSYALLVLLTSIGLVCFLRATRRGHGRALVGWAAASALALATHYFAIFPVAVEAGWLLWTRRHGEGAGRVRVAVGAVAVAALAIAPLALAQERSGLAQYISDASLIQRIAQVPKQFLVGYDGPAQVPLAVASAVLLAIAVLGVGRELRGRRAAASVAVVALLAVGVPVAAALSGADFLNTRNVLPGLMPVLVLAGVGLAAGRRRRALPCGIALVAIGVFTVLGVDRDPVYQRTAWRSLDDALGAVPERRILVVSPGNAGVPLAAYRAGLSVPSGSPAAVREIDVAGLAEKTSAGANATPPSPSAEPPPAPGFALVARTTTSTYTLRRYRAGRPLRVAPQTLSAAKLSPTYALLVVPPAPDSRRGIAAGD